MAQQKKEKVRMHHITDMTDEVMDRGYKQEHITNADVENMKGKVFTDVRFTMGKVYGYEEWEERRKKVLDHPMH